MHRFLATAAIALALPHTGATGAWAKRATVSASQTALLIWIAEERGAEALIDGQAGSLTSSDTAFVSRSVQHPDPRVLATISVSDTTRLHDEIGPL